MEARQDALCAAAELVLRVRDAAACDPGRGRDGRPARRRAGRGERDPRARDREHRRARARPGATRLARRCDRLRADAARRAGAMDEAMRAVLREELEGTGCRRRSSSPARATTRACSPGPACAARCSSSAAARAAISHAPEEWSEPEDVGLCVDVLASTLSRLASAP